MTGGAPSRAGGGTVSDAPLSENRPKIVPSPPARPPRLPPRPNSTPIRPPRPHSIHPHPRADITNAALSGADSTAALGTKKTLKSERKADDVDARDASNPQAVTEYVNDMYAHFREKELETSVNPSVLRP